MAKTWQRGRKVVEATHILTQDVTQGNLPNIIPAGTQVRLEGSRKEEDGSWSVLLSTPTITFSTKWDNCRKLTN